MRRTASLPDTENFYVAIKCWLSQTNKSKKKQERATTYSHTNFDPIVYFKLYIFSLFLFSFSTGVSLVNDISPLFETLNETSPPGKKPGATLFFTHDYSSFYTIYTRENGDWFK